MTKIMNPNELLVKEAMDEVLCENLKAKKIDEFHYQLEHWHGTISYKVIKDFLVFEADAWGFHREWETIKNALEIKYKEKLARHEAMKLGYKHYKTVREDDKIRIQVIA
jgi:hypothetical protein